MLDCIVFRLKLHRVCTAQLHSCTAPQLHSTAQLAAFIPQAAVDTALLCTMERLWGQGHPVDTVKHHWDGGQLLCPHTVKAVGIKFCCKPQRAALPLLLSAKLH